MVAVQGKLKTGRDPEAEDSLTHKRVGVGNFKVYLENETLRESVDGDTCRKAKGNLITSRLKSVLVKRGTTQTNASVSKGTHKNLEKSKGKLDNSVKTNVGRKALADVSNVQGHVSRNEVHHFFKPVRVSRTTASVSKGSIKNFEKSKGKHDSSVKTNLTSKRPDELINSQNHMSRNKVNDCLKSMKGKSERSTSLQRVLVCPGTGSASASSSKPFTGQVRKKLGQGVGGYHTSKGGLKDLKGSVKDQRTKGQCRESLNTDHGITARKPPIVARKSLPVFKRANQLDTSDVKENIKFLEKGKGKHGFTVKARVGQKVVPPLSNGRSHLWRNRASDGFILMASRDQTNVDAGALSRKSARPIVKTTLTTAQKTSKIKCTSGSNESIPVAPISSKNKVEVEKPTLVVPHEPTEGDIQSDVSSNSNTKTTVIITRRKSNRRRSYTSQLIAGSKLLEKHGDFKKQEKFPSIDDKCNHLEVSEYVDEIYQYYWVTEAQNQTLPNYMTIQTDITPQMRGILINWLIEVHLKFDLMHETLYLMVSLLDRYLSEVSINRNDMQLVGLTTLLLASKYEDFWHPRIKDLISISAQSYTRDQMLGMEKLILRKLKFRLNVPTPYVFMLRFLKAAQSDIKLEHLSFYLVELCLVQYEALKYKSSMLCASAIYVARCTLQMNPAWTRLLGKHARYEEEQIRECAEMILRFHKGAKTALLSVTYEKYMKPDLSGVAAIKPLDRLPH